MMTFRNLTGIWLLSIAAVLAGCRQEPEWAVLSRLVRTEFHDVEHISTRQLSDWMADPSRPPPILLDARSAAEYNVSHLPGARLLDAQTEAALYERPRSQPVVLYCSIGWRSSLAARRLRNEGLEQVYNLEGSIFLWANEGRPLYRGERRVSLVHPYDNIWSRLLKPELRWSDDAGAGNATEQ